MVATALTTAEDLERLPSDEGWFELYEGELRPMSPAGGRASEIGIAIAAPMWGHAVPRRLGKVYGADGGFVIAQNPDTVLSPDAAFVRADRLPPEADQEKFLRLAPDLAVEVVSPTNRMREVLDKVQRYLAAGTRLVWVVEPRRRRVTSHGPDREPRVYVDGDDVDGGDVLPGFRIAVTDIFG